MGELDQIISAGLVLFDNLLINHKLSASTHARAHTQTHTHSGCRRDTNTGLKKEEATTHKTIKETN